MARVSALLLSTASLLLASACTQHAVQVEMMGHKVFAQNGVFSLENIAALAPAAPYVPAQIATAPAPASPYGHMQEHVDYNDYVAQKQPAQNVSRVASVQSNDIAYPKQQSTVLKVSNSEIKKTYQAKPVQVAKAQPKPSYIQPPRIVKKEGGYIWPVSSNKVVSSFGPKGSGQANDGINISAPSGEPVWAAADGEVVYVDNALKSKGNMVIVKHAGGKSTSYAHLDRTTIEKYDRVKQGDIIGFVGTSGRVNNPQLYFEVRKGSDPIDPSRIVTRSVAGL